MTLFILLGLLLVLLLGAAAVFWLRSSGASTAVEDLPPLELELERRRPPTYEMNQGRPVLMLVVRNPARRPVTVQEVRLRVGGDPPAIDLDVSREDYFGGARLLPCRLDASGGEATFWIDEESLKALVAAGRNGTDDVTVVLSVVDSLDRTRRISFSASAVSAR